MSEHEKLIHEYAHAIGAYLDAQTAFLVHLNIESLDAFLLADSERRRLRHILERNHDTF